MAHQIASDTNIPVTSPSFVPRGAGPPPVWNYDIAFSRNRGLISSEEQERLRNCRVAIAGMGGVGGEHLITLTRMGIGKFTIADPDQFEVANFNRQYGGTQRSVNKNKAEAMAKEALDINPELDIRVITKPVTASNVDQFLDGADLFVDAIDAFVVDARRITFTAARDKQIPAISAGPVGFSTVWLTFDPSGMSFDEYFDLQDEDPPEIQKFKFLAGMVPSLLHRSYLDSSHVSIRENRGPSVCPACKLAAGVLAIESLKLLLGRGHVRMAPTYHQYDAYRQRLVKKKLWLGNRNPIQKLKLWWLKQIIS